MIEATRIDMSYSRKPRASVLVRVFETDEASEPAIEFKLVGRAGAGIEMLLRHQADLKDHEVRWR